MESGYYKHYKGGIYYVYGIFTHTETTEKMVAYHSVDAEQIKCWVRPLSMFSDVILVNNEMIPRFSKMVSK